MYPQNASRAFLGLRAGSVAKFKLEKEGRAQGTPNTQSFLDLVQTLHTAAKRAQSWCSPAARLFICCGGNRSAIQQELAHQLSQLLDDKHPSWLSFSVGTGGHQSVLRGSSLALNKHSLD